MGTNYASLYYLNMCKYIPNIVNVNISTFTDVSTKLTQIIISKTKSYFTTSQPDDVE